MERSGNWGVFIYLGYVARQREIASFLLIFLLIKPNQTFEYVKRHPGIHLTVFNKRDEMKNPLDLGWVTYQQK